MTDEHGRGESDPIRDIVRRFWLPEFYGEFPEDRTTADLVEWMCVWNGKAHASLRLANATCKRRGEQRDRAREAARKLAEFLRRNGRAGTVRGRALLAEAEAALDGKVAPDRP